MTGKRIIIDTARKVIRRPRPEKVEPPKPKKPGGMTGLR